MDRTRLVHRFRVAIASAEASAPQHPYLRDIAALLDQMLAEANAGPERRSSLVGALARLVTEDEALATGPLGEGLFEIGALY